MIKFYAAFIWRKTVLLALWTIALLTIHLTAMAQTPGCGASAGTLEAVDVCLLREQTILKATNRGDTLVPGGYQVRYVLTRGSELVIEQVSNEPIFALPDSLTGLYTLHTLVYNPNTLNLNNIVLGQTTGFQVNALLVQGGGTICAALDVRGAKVRFGNCEDTCVARAGTLRAVSNNCLRDGKATLTAAVQQAPIVPTGYTRLYVLTRGDSLVIQAVHTTPSFVVNTTGKFTIHTLVYDSTTLDLDTIQIGQTTGFQVNALLVQGGGSICGALDLAGAAFNVGVCPPICNAQAGKLKSDNEPCLWKGKATLIAKTLQAPTVPSGFQVRYVLTSGYGLIIQQLSTTPSFVVNTAGLYTIHTLVYHPNTLNLNNIQLGQTPALFVNSLLLQGGGSICGSLDLSGATFEVEACPPPVCHAQAGELKPDNDPCLASGQAILKAKFWYQPAVPYGYKVVFLLTSGHHLRIEQVNNAPYFTVHRTGKFTIHTLVYDPTTLDLQDIKLGVTTAQEVEEWLVQGGGYICGALDVEGAAFQVENCPVVCNAKAGTLQPANTPCLLNDTATLKAQIVQNPVVPTGYAIRYVLTSGNNLVIRALSKTPAFLVKSTGRYTIHTLVYDSTTLHLNLIKLGVTTAYDIHKLLVQGGGSICGALGLEGAKFELKDCANACTVQAGQLKPLRSSVCLTVGGIRVNAIPTELPKLDDGYQVAYVLTFGANLIIEKVGASPSFLVNKTGTFRVHTLVYDPNTLDLDDIEWGVTTANAFNQQLIQGGGTICGALDLTGATVQVSQCSESNANSTNGKINAYPNPATHEVNLTFEKAETVQRIQIELLDGMGKVVRTWQLDGGTTQTTLDISALSAGIYNMRIAYDRQPVQNLRIAKAE